MSNFELGLDFRSDTVTHPSADMRGAMAAAAVGDDVFGEDPSINALEESCANRFGHEAGLFVPTGCMGNLIALMTHARPGTMVFAGERSHINQFELGSYARVAGLSMRAIDDGAGWLDVRGLRSVWPDDPEHMADPGVVAIENTHNMCGGLIFPVDALIELSAFLNERGVPLHMDGARLLHASVACGLDATAWTAHVDSVMMCFSKGLGAPVGSVLTGSRTFVAEARRNRKLLGGGMRQAGILAAAASYALEHHVDQLEQGHAQCRRVFDALAPSPRIDPVKPHTNILMIDVVEGGAEHLERHLAAEGIGVIAIGASRVRVVFHRDLHPQAAERLVQSVLSWRPER